jgi:hypothetical protein
MPFILLSSPAFPAVVLISPYNSIQTPFSPTSILQLLSLLASHGMPVQSVLPVKSPVSACHAKLACFLQILPSGPSVVQRWAVCKQVLQLLIVQISVLKKLF